MVVSEVRIVKRHKKDRMRIRFRWVKFGYVVKEGVRVRIRGEDIADILSYNNNDVTIAQTMISQNKTHFLRNKFL